MILNYVIFRATEVSKKEKVKFDVICGDFNIDNLSPSDQLAAGNRLFSEYSDPAALRTPGADQVKRYGGKLFDFNMNTMAGAVAVVYLILI